MYRILNQRYSKYVNSWQNIHHRQNSESNTIIIKNRCRETHRDIVKMKKDTHYLCTMYIRSLFSGILSLHYLYCVSTMAACICMHVFAMIESRWHALILYYKSRTRYKLCYKGYYCVLVLSQIRMNYHKSGNFVVKIFP